MVLNDGPGSCLSRSGERCNFPISCPLEDRPEEFGDGFLHDNANRLSQTPAQTQAQQSAQQHTDGPNATLEDIPDPNHLQQTSSGNSNSQPKKKKKKKIKKNTRAAMHIATLNMRGRGTGNNDKWNNINQMVKECRIAVLAVQEAHLTQQHVDNLHQLFGKRLQIHFSQGPNSNAQGVAIVLNRELTNIKGIRKWEIIPGRAMLMTLPWHADLLLTILNVYAPNAHNENQKFWEELSTVWEEQDLPKPDIMLGDFNIVEDAIDRLPSHHDPPGPVKSLDTLRASFHLLDGWRANNPDDKHFSFLQQATATQSRIDRIYASNKIVKSATDWKIDWTGLSTDHKLVSARVVDQKTPYIGQGRWTMPLFLLKDKTLVAEIQCLGKKLEDKLDENLNRTVANPQTLFKQFKDEVIALVRSRAKVAIPKMNQQIKCLRENLDNLLRDKNLDADTLKQSTGILEERIAQIEMEKHQKNCLSTAAHDRLEGETISKYWSSVNKPRNPRDTIFELEKPNTDPPEYQTHSYKMAQLARDYHHSLLLKGLDTPPAERDGIIEDVLAKVDATNKLSDRGNEYLTQKLSEHEVLNALKSSKNGTATGINGLPYELWKTLHNQFETDSKTNKPTFNIIKVLTKVYNDIEGHGVSPNTAFTMGWMCPLYKKKDRRKIENYHPITLLNSDYKVFTKALAVCLTKLVPNIIHENQAGFIAGRSIFDQVRLSKLMVDYAEAVEQNGVIIALDQEKAYDKVTHDYLWKTLAKYNFPDVFIQTVRSLYESAETQVMINGVLSPSFKVSRGVRQGDPLSCLLFDIAIEPLANMLRQSNLKGINIPGVREKLITNLFADDTTVFLSEVDKFSDLELILQKWCIASGARFNVNKTEVLPIGSTQYRASVIATRCIHPSQQPLAGDIHIAQDREPVRVLGGWIGNNVDQVAVWTPTLDKIRQALDRWNNSHPTLFGRRLIIQMVTGGMTQYLTTVQGMPKYVMQILNKITRNFMWDGRKAQVNLNTLYLPIKEGGVKLLDIKARNQAIDIVWLKKYLDLGSCRPIWAYLVDILISENITRASGNVASLAQMTHFCSLGGLAFTHH
jgi:exonuclease III